MKPNTRETLWIAALAALMLLTRGELLGTLVPVQLHDASWAAFLLAGAVLRKPVFLVVLALLALGMDYAALCAGGLNLGACLKPSYPALMLSWAVLWGAGRMIRMGRHDAATLGQNLLIVLAAVTGAYLLTSGGFFLWSGLYEGWTLAQYWNMSASFFLVALGSTTGYVVLGLLAQQIVRLTATGSGQTAH